MKKLIALMLMSVTMAAQAQHHHHHPYYRGNSGSWVTPMLIGGVVGYAISRSHAEPVYNYGYVPPPTVIVQQPVSVCSPWTETQHADGTITRTRTCP